MPRDHQKARMTNSLDAFLRAADELDPPEKPSHIDWCKNELPHKFTLPWGPHHRWLFGQIGMEPMGVRVFEGAARGSGKTTSTYVGLPMSCIALGTHRFIIICKETQQEAEAQLKIIRDELDTNQDLTDRWPNLKYVKQRRYGMRDKTNLNREIQLVGGRIVAVGAGSSIRGIIRNSETGEILRPDLFIFDDLEDPEQARSTYQTNNLEEWLFGDVSNLGGNTVIAKRMDMVGIGTTLSADALATRALNKKGRFKSWRTRKFPAEFKDANGKRAAGWPEGQPLELLDTLLDPESEQFLGFRTYSKEFLLDPKQDTDTLVAKESILYGRVPRRQDGSVDLRHIAHGLDPSANEKAHKNNDPHAIVSVGLDRLNRVWVYRAWRAWTGKNRLFDVAENFYDTDPESTVAYEAVAGFKWGVQELRERNISHRSVQPFTDKISRFKRVELLYESNASGFAMIIHDESLKDTTFEDELTGFPTGDHDDFVDALWLAVMLATNDGRRTRKEQVA